MPWGGGAFNRFYGATGWTDDKLASTFIVSSRHDTHDQDLADGINACITRDNQAKPTADFAANATNSFNLGTSSVSWKQLFLGTIKAAIWDDASSILGYYGRTSAETAASVTPTNYFYPELDVRRYGGVFDGVTNDAAAWQSAADVLAKVAGTRRGGKVFAPALPTLVNTQVTWLLNNNAPSCIEAYGCDLKTTTAIIPFLLSGPTRYALTIRGLHFDHDGNGTVLGAIDGANAQHVNLECQFSCGTLATYIGVTFRNSVAATDSTGSFWSKVKSDFFSTTSAGQIGIKFKGAANACSVYESTFQGISAPIVCTNEVGQTTMPNGMDIHHCAFEGYVTAINSLNNASECQTGLRIISNRFESGTTVFNHSPTAAADPSVPPVLFGNYLISSAGTYINNPNARSFTSFDVATTPAQTNGLTINNAGPLVVKSTGNTAHSLDIWAAAVELGHVLRNSAGTIIGSFLQRTGGGSRLSANELRVTSATATAAAGEIAFGTTTATTVGAAGGASAQPATPVGYLIINIAGTDRKIPFHNT